MSRGGNGTMLKKALIVTVGTGTRADADIVRALVKTVECVNAARP